jgi:hypothetical protein
VQCIPAAVEARTIALASTSELQCSSLSPFDQSLYRVTSKMNVLRADSKRYHSVREHDCVRHGAVTQTGSGYWLIASFTSAVAASCSMWSKL